MILVVKEVTVMVVIVTYIKCFHCTKGLIYIPVGEAHSHRVEWNAYCTRIY